MRTRVFVLLPLFVVATIPAALASSCGDDAAEPELEPVATTTIPAETSDATGSETDATETDATGSETTTSAAAPTTSTTEVPAPTTTRERLDPDDPDYPVLPPSPTVTYPDTDDGT